MMTNWVYLVGFAAFFILLAVHALLKRLLIPYAFYVGVLTGMLLCIPAISSWWS